MKYILDSDTFKVWTVATIPPWLTLANVNGVLVGISVIVSIAYTIHKWRRGLRRDKEHDTDL